MPNNTEDYKNLIEEKNLLLENYKDLIVAYEDSRKIYEKLIAEYEDEDYTETDAVPCSQIVGYLNSARTLKWALLLMDGTQIYESVSYTFLETWIFQLGQLGVEPGTKLQLKAILGVVDDEVSSIILEYVPNSNTVYFEYRQMTGYNHYVRYHGMISSCTKPPVLKCAGVTAYNDNLNLCKWSLVKEDGTTIYTSGRYRTNERWTITFADIKKAPGTRMLVKANIVAGADSKGYVILEYDPTTTAIAKFTADGSAFKSILMYKGTM